MNVPAPIAAAKNKNRKAIKRVEKKNDAKKERIFLSITAEFCLKNCRKSKEKTGFNPLILNFKSILVSINFA